MMRLLNDLLEISKIEAGRLDFEQIPFDLRELLGICDRRTAAWLRARGSPSLWRQTRSFPRPLVGGRGTGAAGFRELLGNAVKFTRQGSVSVRVSVLFRTADRCGS
jgi:signal transduction histidine kinase